MLLTRMEVTIQCTEIQIIIVKMFKIWKKYISMINYTVNLVIENNEPKSSMVWISASSNKAIRNTFSDIWVVLYGPKDLNDSHTCVIFQWISTGRFCQLSTRSPAFYCIRYVRVGHENNRYCTVCWGLSLNDPSKADVTACQFRKLSRASEYHFEYHTPYRSSRRS